MKIQKPAPWTKVLNDVFAARIMQHAEYGGYGFYETHVYRVEHPEHLDTFLSRCQEWQNQGLHLIWETIGQTSEFKALGKLERVSSKEISY